MVPMPNLHSAGQDTYGNGFLKVSPTSYAICKLIYGASQRNASLAANQNLQELKSLRNAKCQGAMDETEGGHGGEEEEGENEAEEPPAKKKKLGSFSVEITVKGVTCCILCPSKRVASADLMVKMDSAQLAAVCEYIKEGYTPGELLPTRSYQTSGKFRKVAQPQTDE